jgi:release factor glutamine methyltransferase
VLRTAGCVFAEDEARLLLGSARSTTELTDMIGRRVVGHPLEHVLGWVEFLGSRIIVTYGVFVPRRRTGHLALRAIDLAKQAEANGGAVVVVDLCCGSGAVGTAVLAAVDRVELHASDVDSVAVDCARRNIGAGGAVHHGDLFAALPDGLHGRVDVLVANVPYVPSGEIGFLPPEARVHEPRGALDGGDDGLDVLRRVTAGVAEWLAPGGQLLMETGEHQAGAAAAIIASHGLTVWTSESDEYYAMVVGGTADRECRRAVNLCPGAAVIRPVGSRTPGPRLSDMSEQSTANDGKRLSPGDRAPDFSLPDADGNTVSLADFRGRQVIVYFYPAASTPGCTKQACDFRDGLAELDDAGIAVVGISPDEPTKLAKFRDEEKLTFPLLSDLDRGTLIAWGAFGEKTMYGRTVTGVIRSTFLVDADGTIARAMYNVRATGHVARLRRELKV